VPDPPSRPDPNHHSAPIAYCCPELGTNLSLVCLALPCLALYVILAWRALLAGECGSATGLMALSPTTLSGSTWGLCVLRTRDVWLDSGLAINPVQVFRT
jgi:hypothetical protein